MTSGAGLHLLALVSCLLLLSGVTRGRLVKRSDDTNPLEPVVQQLSQTVQTLQAEFAAVKSAVQKVVAFTVFLSAGSVTLAPHGHVMFDNVEINIGNGYNKNSGIFTAPYSGIYVFLLTVTSVGDHSIQLAIDKSGTTLDNLHDDWDKGTAHVLVHLNAGDEVWARHNSGDTEIYGDWWTSFTGFLLHAD